MIEYMDADPNSRNHSSCSQASKVEACLEREPVEPIVNKPAAVDPGHVAFFEKLIEELECGICCDLMHDPVLLSPCQHLNCGGCLSDWFKKEQVCPTCRIPLECILRSRKHRNLIDMVLEYKPECRRDPLLIGELNACNIFTVDKYVVKPEKEVEKVAEIRELSPGARR